MRGYARWVAGICGLVLAFACLPGPVGSADEIDINGASNGEITWTNVYTKGVFTIEWAPDLDGTWYSNWDALDHQPVVGDVMSVPVPRFFRVVNDPLRVEWVGVSNAHNTADSTGYGRVNYDFRIGKYEVNNGLYVKFLNAVDPLGANSLKLYSTRMATDPRGGITNDPSAADGAHYGTRYRMYQKPVNFVSFWDAARFVNWLHNGQGSGGTESGVYDLESVNPDNDSVTRSPGARYFIPSEDEWYKAGYYDAGSAKFWLYPVQSDAAPSVALCNAIGGISNDASVPMANYSMGAVWNGSTGNVTGIGSGGAGMETYYGAADMAGNVYEWNEGLVDGDQRCIRGGSWASVVVFLQSTVRNGYAPTTELDSVGFRVAAPSSSDASAGSAVDDPDDGDDDDDGPPGPV